MKNASLNNLEKMLDGLFTVCSSVPFDHLGDSKKIAGAFSSLAFDHNNKLTSVVALKRVDSSKIVNSLRQILKQQEKEIYKKGFKHGKIKGMIEGFSICAAAVAVVSCFVSHKKKKQSKKNDQSEQKNIHRQKTTSENLLAQFNNQEVLIALLPDESSVPQIYTIDNNNFKEITLDEYMARMSFINQIQTLLEAVKRDTSNCVIVDCDRLGNAQHTSLKTQTTNSLPYNELVNYMFQLPDIQINENSNMLLLHRSKNDMLEEPKK